MKDEDRASVRAPWHLWLVGLLGLLWNSVGAFDFLMVQTRSESYAAQFTAEQLDAFGRFPVWLVGTWGLAVWGGVVGSLLLLLRKRLSERVLLASLLAMVVTGIHDFASVDGLYATGGTGPAFVMLIFLVALGLWSYARTVGP